MERESFKSRLGFLLVSAGCAIGIGNVWKFPFITGQNGGGVFVFFYLLFLVIMGAPVLAMELSVGRASRKSVIQGYKALEPKGSKWHVHGWFCIAGCYLLMMYYTTVSGWMLDYFVKFLTGKFDTVKADVVPNVFTDMLGNTGAMALFMIVSVAAGILVCSIGIQNGVERISKVMMLCLLALIVILAVHSLLLPGAKEGVKFYLLPDFKRAMDNGIGAAITAAMNQSFFTLSIGISSMEIFGSYLSKDYSIGGESLRICVLDTFVAIMSGLIIFPACFSYGIETTAGPSLIFITLPQVRMIADEFAAFSIDTFGMSRKKSVVMNGILVWVLSIPCVLGYNIWSGIHLIGGRDILDTEDFIVSNLLLPIGSLIFALFCTVKYGWGFDNFIKEANTGKGAKIPRGLKYYFMIVLPILILVILVQGLIA